MRCRKPTVGDVEILYIPYRGTVCPAGEIFPRMCNLADAAIDSFLSRGTFETHLAKGHLRLGEKNKLAAHNPTGIPVELPLSATMGKDYGFFRLL